MADYNWEMTGAPDPNVAWTDPEAFASYNQFVAQKNAESGGAGQQLASISPEGTFVPAPAPTEPPSWLRPEDYVSSGFAAPYTPQEVSGQIDPSWYRPAAGGVTYASVRGPSDYSGGEFVIDTNTGKFARDANGNLIPVPRPNTTSSGWFNDWGVLGLPLLAAGGVAALEGLGAFGGGAEALGGTEALGGIGPDYWAGWSPTGSEAGFASTTVPADYGFVGPLVSEGGIDIAAADAAAAAAGASSIPNWLSALAGPAAKLGTSGLSSALRQGATSGLAPSLGKLATGQTGYGMEVPGIVRTNVNPFFNTPQAPLQTPQKTELSSLPDLLRQKSPWQT